MSTDQSDTTATRRVPGWWAWLVPGVLAVAGFLLLGAGIAYGVTLGDGPRQLMKPVMAEQCVDWRTDTR